MSPLYEVIIEESVVNNLPSHPSHTRSIGMQKAAANAPPAAPPGYISTSAYSSSPSEVTDEVSASADPSAEPSPYPIETDSASYNPATDTVTDTDTVYANAATSTTPADYHDHSNGLPISTPILAGIIAAVVAILIGAVLLFWCTRLRKKSAKRAGWEKSNDSVAPASSGTLGKHDEDDIFVTYDGDLGVPHNITTHEARGSVTIGNPSPNMRGASTAGALAPPARTFGSRRRSTETTASAWTDGTNVDGMAVAGSSRGARTISTVSRPNSEYELDGPSSTWEPPAGVTYTNLGGGFDSANSTMMGLYPSQAPSPMPTLGERSATATPTAGYNSQRRPAPPQLLIDTKGSLRTDSQYLTPAGSGMTPLWSSQPSSAVGNSYMSNMQRANPSASDHGVPYLQTPSALSPASFAPQPQSGFAAAATRQLYGPNLGGLRSAASSSPSLHSPAVATMESVSLPYHAHDASELISPPMSATVAHGPTVIRHADAGMAFEDAVPADDAAQELHLPPAYSDIYDTSRT